MKRLPISRKLGWIAVLALFFLCLVPGFCPAFSDEEIGRIQQMLQGESVGERIARWAEKFLGVPYDEDPQGMYVTRAAIVADEKVDCMYLTFRSVELALSRTPDEALQIALEKRFHHRGSVQNGKVVNYEDRYQYGEDMIVSGKWGKEITSSLGRTKQIHGSRGKDFWNILPAQEFLRASPKLMSGDLVYFIKDVKRRTVGESVGHIGILKVEEKAGKKTVYLIHASGSKNGRGEVKKVLLKDYLAGMPFIGVQVTRFP